MKESSKSITESHNLSDEEKVIKNLEKYMKQRNCHIGAVSLLLICMLSMSILFLWRERKLNKMITPEQIGRMASFDNPKDELPILFSRFYILAGLKAKLIVYECYFGVFTGLVIFVLINEIAGFTRNKHKLILFMWEKINQLEDEVKELKAHAQADDQRGIDHTTN